MCSIHYFDITGLFPYGTAARDRTLGSNTYETMEVTIEDGFPFGDSLREAVYVRHDVNVYHLLASWSFGIF